MSYRFKHVPLPIITVTCRQCGRSVSNKHDTIYADLNGKPFEAYYCRVCKKDIEQERI